MPSLSVPLIFKRDRITYIFDSFAASSCSVSFCNGQDYSSLDLKFDLFPPDCTQLRCGLASLVCITHPATREFVCCNFSKSISGVVCTLKGYHGKRANIGGEMCPMRIISYCSSSRRTHEMFGNCVDFSFSRLSSYEIANWH